MKLRIECDSQIGSRAKVWIDDVLRKDVLAVDLTMAVGELNIATVQFLADSIDVSTPVYDPDSPEDGA